MRVVTYTTETGARVGILDGDERIVALDEAAGLPTEPSVFFGQEDWPSRLRELDLDRLKPLPGTGVRLGPPQPSPSKVVAVGLNYRDHCRESGQEVPELPVLFAKWPSSIIGPEEVITFPAGEVRQLDYEAELAVVIGRGCRRVSAGEALSFVGGYTIGNDVSARDVQFRDGQWTLAKSYDTFCPLGPAIVTADEIVDVQNLSVRCTVNGETRQDSSTQEMVFSVAEIVSYISSYVTLNPGDVILTGTPAGVGLGFDPPRWLSPGDDVVCEIERIGQLRNEIAADAPDGN